MFTKEPESKCLSRKGKRHKIQEPGGTKPDIVDQLKLIEEFTANPKASFRYMVYAVDPSSKYFTPYALKIVPYKQIDCPYMTISASGVTQYSCEEMTFTSLHRWAREYNFYLELMELKTFRLFRLWKSFYIWHKIIRLKKFNNARNFITNNLFICNRILANALFDIRKMYDHFLDYSFMDTSVIEKITLYYFVELQLKQLENSMTELNKFRNLIVDITYDACNRSLNEVGYTILDSNITIAQTAYGKLGTEASKIYINNENYLKMSFIEQTNKREHCQRLSRFIHLIDYTVTSLLRNVLENTYIDLLKVLRIYTNILPHEIQFSNIQINVNRESVNHFKSPFKNPYWVVDIVLTEEGEIKMDPSDDVFWFVIERIQSMWRESLANMKPLLTDSRFESFTKPIINFKRQKDYLRGEPPSISDIISNDTTIKTLVRELEDLLELNIIAVRRFCERFSDVEAFYIEDKNFNENIILSNTNCDVFRQWCERYKNEEHVILNITDLQPVRIFFLQLKRFKEKALLAPVEKMKLLEKIIPEIGKSKVKILGSEAFEALSFLDNEPSTTEDFVEYISFVDHAQQKVDDMETEMNYIKDLYDIIEDFDIPVSIEDTLQYTGLSMQLTSLRLSIDNRLEEREKLVRQFNEKVENDIQGLINDISNINDEATKSWLLRAKSDANICLKTLEKLTKRLEDCAEMAEKYKMYQRQFKLEITRLDILDQVTNRLRLRTLLWQTNITWSEALENWYCSDFNTLDVDEMNNMIMRYTKNVTQLEKGLEENDILPRIKSQVKLFCEKLPTISYLKNHNLKKRHWLKIESLMNRKLQQDETLTLKLIEELGVFDHEKELMEIAGAASAEATLENMLEKIQDTWKHLEFIVLGHKESSDVFVLGSLEEVQAALDESNIAVQTIAASRHVAPIKARLDEWIKQLELFSMTLESWQYCQQQWLYLEAIFSAPDIQRQLPVEAKLFIQVDKSWKDIMRRVAKMPLAMVFATQPGLFEQLEDNNRSLDEITKCLEAYLDTKRIAFPRFFFLSNDELLEILAQTRNPHAVQRHLQKCFDAIYRLEFASAAPEKNSKAKKTCPILTTDILAMISPEGEKVSLGKGLKARGSVEDWLGKVEESMFTSLRRKMKFAIADLEKRKRRDFIYSHPSQIVLTVSQINWTRNVHLILEVVEDINKSIKSFEQKCHSDLNELASMVRSELPTLIRDIIINLITIDVHARDIVTSLIENNVTSSSNFEWNKNLRYYWDQELDNCVTRMSSAEYLYGYEYLGAQKRLVITPLTDKCYLCLMGALQLNLGGAPAGPAGTGKTETTKDLAKALAIQCVVFNCSEGLDYRMMGRFFSGLATSGAWCCFDEFNRIDIEVLSVIAQQLITIRNAKVARANEFLFEGRNIKLVMSCATFITMNPGYAGRTELPDNLKSLFRPIAMMVPDYKLIAEVILYSEGFESSKQLSKKMTLMYTLCSEQLSQQDHYDFGMRAVKSVLVMAGSLKRENPDKSEELVLIKALRDSNLPKFLADDAQLFLAILADLFPSTEIPQDHYGIFRDTIVDIMNAGDLQPETSSVIKTIQLHETIRVRHGVMLVGPTGAGKTTILKTLRATYTSLADKQIPGPLNKRVNMYTINPKAITMSELYGEVDIYSNEWHDGLLGAIIRKACSSETDDHQWIVCDGPVDALWIENMNTVLDDNKMLCLANSERIKFTPFVRMIFEVMDLCQASPATVSRCGMVYVDPLELGWMPYVKTWLIKLKSMFKESLASVIVDVIYKLFDQYVDDGLTFFKKNCDCAIAQVDISKVNTVCTLLESILLEPDSVNKIVDKSRLTTFVTQSFAFSYIWGIGGNVIDSSREAFELFVTHQLEQNSSARLPVAGDLWNLFMNTHKQRMDLWLKIMPAFDYNPDTPFFDILVPTIDTVRFGFIIKKIINANKSVFITGATGVGKSVIMKGVLNNLRESELWSPVTLNLSGQTTSKQTQDIFELKLEKKKRFLLGAPVGKRVCVFVDDVNMPRLDTYGSQPPIELLRQVLDFRGFYDRKKLIWKSIEDVVLTAACAPPGGGRNPLSKRFIRHFAMLMIPIPAEASLQTIFRAIVRGFLNHKSFPQSVVDIGDKIVNATVEIYDRIATDLLPTPGRSHYIFNLRDLSKCVQGIMQSDPMSTRDARQMTRLFYHECLRIFHDRLVDNIDKSYFCRLLTQTCSSFFAEQVIPLSDDIIDSPPALFFGDFMKFGTPRALRIYEEVTDVEKIKSVLQDYLDDYCLATKKDLKLIFFLHAIEHLFRVARILRSERGHGLLVGVGGMGKQSLTKLASHLNGYPCWQIEISRGYDINSWHTDLRNFYFKPGAFAEDATFLFTDTQIVTEEFIEDINNTLNSGEVPNLFESEELEKIIIATRPAAKEAGIPEENRDEIYNLFVSRVRNHLHVVLCMSPAGDAFRRRCRMFPSLVNCCTIDWFTKWPDEALLSVAKISIMPNITQDMQLASSLASICVLMHQTTDKMTERYFIEMRRRYYTTPSSYLELLTLYSMTLKRKRDEIMSLKIKIENGLNKLNETRAIVAVMKNEIILLTPELKTSREEVEKLMKVVTKQQTECDKVRNVVAADEAVAKKKADEMAILEIEARKDLEAAIPALEEAQKALQSLNKSDINEIKVFNKPPHLVRYVMEAVCLLLGEKTDWPTAKLILSDVRFLDRLINFPKDDIDDKLLKKLQSYLNNPEFVPNTVAKQSKVCKSICIWVRAIDGYAKVFRVVEPKRIKLKEAQEELQAIKELVTQKQKQLSAVVKKIEGLEKQYNKAVKHLDHLESTITLNESRLNRSGRLIAALSDGQELWQDMTRGFDAKINNLMGDCLVIAGALAYFGAFTQFYRQELLRVWLKAIENEGIDITSNFNLVASLISPYKICTWNIFGLPKDNVSTENALLVTQTRRWPLLIDPQEQGYRWIRNMELENDIKISEMNNPNLMRIIENCIRLGLPVMIYNVQETLDPSLEPILLQQIFMQEGRMIIRINNTDIEYEKGFKLYITTKLSNPHYLPEVCIKVTLVNFTVTPSGLEDQLLAEVVKLERPDLEKQREELVEKISHDGIQLEKIEEKILSMLSGTQGNILDNEELVESLNNSKETSAIITSRLVESEKTEAKIIIARDKYRSVATQGFILFFVIASLAEIDPMYQYSLKYFKHVFNHAIETSEKNQDINKSLSILHDRITLAIYLNISRGLFERHKIILALMIDVAMRINDKTIAQTQWNFILRGPGSIEVNKKPEQLTDLAWKSINYLDKNFTVFNGILADAFKKITLTLGNVEEEINVDRKNIIKATKDWNTLLSDIEKLMLVKSLKEEKLLILLTSLVNKDLGQKFIESSIVTLPDTYQDTSYNTPLIFILSTGCDPFGSFIKFAAEMGFIDKYSSISLGQGQGPIAERLIKDGCTKGHWIFLQNCHLARSWMPTLERLVTEITEGSVKVHGDFRLFLSSMPSAAFPISILENAVKITNEPPKGLKANIKRMLFDMNQEFFEQNDDKWRVMIFGICFFHSIIQERKKYGPLGWNILYEFTDNDRECCLSNLKIFSEDELIPWNALIYTTGEITYGGRITDNWDLRCLKTILENFFSPKIFEKNYIYSPSGIYYCPRLKSLEEYINFIETFPLIDEPEIFGMHENANITYQLNESQLVINTIAQIQPTIDVNTESNSNSEIVYDTAQIIMNCIELEIDLDKCNQIHYKRDLAGRLPSLTTVLLHEVDRYNKLLTNIHASMENLQRAIKGFVVMSEELENIFNSLLNNQVPKVWHDLNIYPSLKSLGSWIRDLELRTDFIKSWLINQQPVSYWISGLSFPQGFITAVLQTHARKYNIPIDHLKLDYSITKVFLYQDDIQTAHSINQDDNLFYKNLSIPNDGVLIHGLYFDAAKWDINSMLLADASLGEMNPPLPVMHVIPVLTHPENDPRYVCPLYKTAIRAGVLSTTGHSTNFVTPILLPSSQKNSYWILKGTALLIQITD
ncbi:dynein axonemal heavy chain 6 [Microplitis demolitor]|uniref:dynein axonemal heavy chain 6 n=1 Tax=Microplitis demolitor TaxID=69319 RepID=UPI00235B6DEC|nr:dynein axonemal heavy chain 6 [Microplitis demolitor]